MKKDKILLRIILVLTGIIAILLILLLEKNKPQSVQENITESQTNAEKQNESKVNQDKIDESKNEETDIEINEGPINTATKETFNNSEMGYSLKYPNGWDAIIGRGDDLRLNLPEGEVIIALTQDNNDNLNLKDWIYSEFPNSYADNFKPVTYGNNQVYENDNLHRIYLKLNNNRILTITYTNSLGPRSSKGTKNIQEFEELLESINLPN